MSNTSALGGLRHPPGSAEVRGEWMRLLAIQVSFLHNAWEDAEGNDD